MRVNERIRPVNGDLLSCYTASVSEYLRQSGVDHELALGTQLYLGVQPQGEVLAFVHQHTPLRGDAPTHALRLGRCWAERPEEAADRIAAEVARIGRAIVVGDTMNVPWQVDHGKAHAPHWFLVDGLDQQAGVVHVVDRFEFIKDSGEQKPFEGWIELGRLGGLAAVNSERRPVFQLRDRFAFGDQEDPDRITLDGFQWFEADGPATPRALGRDQVLELLARTWSHATGGARRGDLDGPGWRLGLEALDFLAEHAGANVANPALYENGDDLWVASRNRQLFAGVLQRLGRELDVDQFEDLGRWCEGELAAKWANLPRVMQYNQGSLERGREPRPLIASLLQEVAARERELVERLGDALPKGVMRS